MSQLKLLQRLPVLAPHAQECVLAACRCSGAVLRSHAAAKPAHRRAAQLAQALHARRCQRYSRRAACPGSTCTVLPALAAHVAPCQAAGAAQGVPSGLLPALGPQMPAGGGVRDAQSAHQTQTAGARGPPPAQTPSLRGRRRWSAAGATCGPAQGRTRKQACGRGTGGWLGLHSK